MGLNAEQQKIIGELAADYKKLRTEIETMMQNSIGDRYVFLSDLLQLSKQAPDRNVTELQGKLEQSATYRQPTKNVLYAFNKNPPKNSAARLYDRLIELNVKYLDLKVILNRDDKLQMENITHPESQTITKTQVTADTDAETEEKKLAEQEKMIMLIDDVLDKLEKSQKDEEKLEKSQETKDKLAKSKEAEEAEEAEAKLRESKKAEDRAAWRFMLNELTDRLVNSQRHGSLEKTEFEKDFVSEQTLRIRHGVLRHKSNEELCADYLLTHKATLAAVASISIEDAKAISSVEIRIEKNRPPTIILTKADIRKEHNLIVPKSYDSLNDFVTKTANRQKDYESSEYLGPESYKSYIRDAVIQQTSKDNPPHTINIDFNTGAVECWYGTGNVDKPMRIEQWSIANIEDKILEKPAAPKPPGPK